MIMIVIADLDHSRFQFKINGCREPENFRTNEMERLYNYGVATCPVAEYPRDL